MTITINDESFVLSISSLHLKYIGVSISNKYANEYQANILLQDRILNTFGFTNDNDYVNCYPNRYNNESYCKIPHIFSANVSKHRNDNFYYALHTDSYTGSNLPHIRKDFELLINERIHNNVIVFPRIRDIMDNLDGWIDTNSIGKYDLWFCYDWSEQ